eukprot:gene3071-3840_t
MNHFSRTSLQTLSKLSTKSSNPSAAVGAGINNLFSTNSAKPRNERLASFVMVHKTCFNTSRLEEKLLEEVGAGMGDPSLNPSPS